MKRVRSAADGVLEACWLAAVVLVPLYIDRTGSDAFETPKAGLLQALAALMVVAWVIKALYSVTADQVPITRTLSTLGRVPLVVTAAPVVVTALVATALSIAPEESVWGHSQRAHGASTLLAEVAIFAALAANLRSSTQIRRLVTALIMPSIPISLYAVVQRLGFEPMLLSARETAFQRSTSLLGQPVFLAAYLDMVIPFTVLRAITTRNRQRLSSNVYGTIAVLQVAAALCSESRGALLGLTLGGALALLSVAARRGRRTVVIACWALFGAGVLAIALGLPGRISRIAETTPQARVAQRAADAFSAASSGGNFRAIVWSVAERALRNRAELEFADGSHDTRAALRPIVGYGLDLQYAISRPAFSSAFPKSFSYVLIDSFHNDLWDVVLTSGALGLLAWLALESALLWLVIRGLGLVDSTARSRLYWTAYLGGAVAGVIGWMAAQGAQFCFLGLQTGVAFGLAVFLSVSAWSRTNREAAASSTRNAVAGHTGLLIAALWAILAHQIETSFSFTIIATGMLFWVISALSLACGQLPDCETAPEHAIGEAVADASLLAWALIALGFAFVGATPLSPSGAGAVLWDALTLVTRPAGARVPAVALIVASTLLGGALLLLVDRDDTGQRRARRVRFMAGSACVGLAYWVWIAGAFSQLAAATSVPAMLAARNQIITSSYVVNLLMVFVFALARAHFSAEQPKGRSAAAPWVRELIAAAVALFAVALIERVSLRPAYASAAAAVGDMLRVDNRFGPAQQAYADAKALLPNGGLYQAMLAKSYAKQASTDVAHADHWLQLADREMRAAIARNPIAGESAINLALITAQRVERASGSQRAALLPQLTPLFERALRMQPMEPVALRRWAHVRLTLLDDPMGALAVTQRALLGDRPNADDYILLADCYRALARRQRGGRQLKTVLAAADAYERAAQLVPGRAALWVAAGKAYFDARRPNKAAASFRAALSALPSDAPERESTQALVLRAEAAEIALATAASPPR